MTEQTNPATAQCDAGGADDTLRMHRIVIAEHGSPDVLAFVEAAIPEPGPGQVRVRILAAGVAFVDRMIRIGGYPYSLDFPVTPGCDMVGVIDKLGASVTGFSLGQRVGAYTKTGGYAEYVCVDAAMLLTVPAGIEPPTAVAAILNYGTAWQMLHRAARTKASDRVLVHGAAGGVGSALVQLAGLEGMMVYGTCSAPKRSMVTDLGAVPIDYAKEDFVERIDKLTGGQGVDAVFDHLGGDHLERSYRTLTADGRLICYGFMGVIAGGVPHLEEVDQTLAKIEELDCREERRSVTLYASIKQATEQPRDYCGDVVRVLELIVAGRLTPLIAEVLPLANAAKAHRLLEDGEIAGKIVLDCSDANARAIWDDD